MSFDLRSRRAGFVRRVLLAMCPAERRPWAQALLSELSVIQGPWSRLAWACGAGQVVAAGWAMRLTRLGVPTAAAIYLTIAGGGAGLALVTTGIVFSVGPASLPADYALLTAAGMVQLTLVCSLVSRTFPGAPRATRGTLVVGYVIFLAHMILFLLVDTRSHAPDVVPWVHAIVPSLASLSFIAATVIRAPNVISGASSRTPKEA